MTDTSKVALATSPGTESVPTYVDGSLPTPEQRRRNRNDWPPRLRRREASAYLVEVHGVQEAPTTLAKKACLGGGPVFELWGAFPIIGRKPSTPTPSHVFRDRAARPPIG